MSQNNTIPTYSECITAVFHGIKELKGPVTAESLMKYVVKETGVRLSDADKEIKGNQMAETLQYRVGCAMAFLKSRGVASKSKDGQWSILPLYADVKDLDIQEVEDTFPLRSLRLLGGEMFAHMQEWEKSLYDTIQKLSGTRYIAMIKRVLDSEGFTDIKVLSGTESGDCYGTAIAPGDRTRRTAFGSKRFVQIMDTDDVRAFRGAFDTNVKRGILISMGDFSREAREDATNPRKLPLKLVDGMQLLKRMMELGLGVQESRNFHVDPSFFNNLEQ